jgi:hypothetical protein
VHYGRANLASFLTHEAFEWLLKVTSFVFFFRWVSFVSAVCIVLYISNVLVKSVYNFSELKWNLNLVCLQFQ